MSQTACPHCSSTNSIETAGQRYCADCGQLITAKKADKSASKSTSKKKEVAKTVAQKAPIRPVKTAPPLNLKAIEKSRAAKPTAKNPAALDLRQAKARPVIKKPIGKHVPPRPIVAKPKPEPVSQAPQVTHKALVEAQTLAPAKKFRHKSALRDALKSIRDSKTIKTALLVALITTVCEAIFMSLFASSGLYAITESFAAGALNVARATTLVGHLAWASLLGFVGYLAYHYGLAIIIFRTSRVFDRRGTNSAQARRAALGSLAGLFIIDVITWALGITATVLVAGANFGFLGTKSLGILGVCLAVATNLIAAYVWLGLIAARHMATYAIVLGQVGVYRAYSTGWAMYSRQFGRVTTGLVVVGLMSLAATLPTLVISTLLDGSSSRIVVTTILVAVTQAIIMIVSAVYFLRVYRFIISQEYDSDLGHLLSGRQPKIGHASQRLMILGIIVAAVAIASVGLIIYAAPVAEALIR